MNLQSQLQIKDDKFDIQRLHEYTLTLELGLGFFDVSVVDTTNKRLLAVEKFTIEFTPTTKDVIAALEQLFKQHSFVSAGFWKRVFIAINNVKYALIPSEYFNQDDPIAALRPICTVDLEVDKVFSTSHPDLGLYNTYLMRKELVQWFRGRYPNSDVLFIHQTDVILEAVRKHYSASEANYVAVIAYQGKFTMVMFQAGKLQYLNSYVYTSEADFVYFILFTIKELHLERESVKVELFGDVAKEGAIYKKLVPYLPQVAMGKRPKWLSYGFQFDEMHDHQFMRYGGIYLTDKTVAPVA